MTGSSKNARIAVMHNRRRSSCVDRRITAPTVPDRPDRPKGWPRDRCETDSSQTRPGLIERGRIDGDGWTSHRKVGLTAPDTGPGVSSTPAGTAITSSL
jgi:hypothetical protein